MRGKRCSDDLFAVVCKTFDRTGGVRATARNLGLNEGSVSRILKRRIGVSHTQRKVKLGRKLFRLPRNFLSYVKRHRHDTLRQLAHQLQMSRMCVKRACHRLGLRSRPAVINKLTDKQKKRRLHWVRDHANTDFSGWIFSDESFFELADCSAPRRPRVLRTAAEKYCSACVLKNVPNDRHGVMVWGRND
jgi:AraC-like DNA-binding protein